MWIRPQGMQKDQGTSQNFDWFLSGVNLVWVLGGNWMEHSIRGQGIIVSVKTSQLIKLKWFQMNVSGAKILAIFNLSNLVWYLLTFLYKKIWKHRQILIRISSKPFSIYLQKRKVYWLVRDTFLAHLPLPVSAEFIRDFPMFVQI